MIFSLSTFAAILVCIIAIYFSTFFMLEKRYQKAVELINHQKWYQAEQALKLVPTYKDAEVLNRYVWANIKLDINDEVALSEHHYQPVLDLLNEIPENYQGNFKEEISEFKNNIMQKANVHNKSDLANASSEQLKSVSIGERHLYFEEEFIRPIFYGL